MKTTSHNEESIFTTLRELPLLKGMSPSRLQHVVGHTPMHFMKFAAGDEIVAAGQECTHLKFIISGQVRLSVANRRFSVDQTLTAPQVIAPDYLFGRTTQYPCSATAITPTGIMQITKEDYRKMLMSDPVFLFNLLNTVSTNSQKGLRGLMMATDGSLEHRIALWVISLTQPGSTDVVLTGLSRELHQILGATRANYLATVEAMKRKGIADFSGTDSLTILSRPALIELISTDNA